MAEKDYIKVMQGKRIVRKFLYPSESKFALVFANALIHNTDSRSWYGKNVFKEDIKVLFPVRAVDIKDIVGSNGVN